MTRISLANSALGAATSLFWGLLLLGCAGPPDTVGGAASDPGGSGKGTPSFQLPDASPSGAGGVPGLAPTGDANCGVVTSELIKAPTDVLLVLDRSGSMNESIAAECCCSSSCRQILSIKMCAETSDCTERWPALTSAVVATIAKTPGINWGLKLFSSPGGLDVCTVNSGVEVGIGESTADVQAQVAGAAPRNSTPTAKAITTATAYLKTVQDGNNKVILLATDGEPNCKAGSLDPSTPDLDGTRAAIAAALGAGFRTYVIGIGPSVSNLDNLAAAGGTGHFYRTTSATDLAGALTAISAAVSGCTFTLPQSPIDPGNVAVYLDGGLVPNDPVNGWSFGTTPQTIMLNGAACTRITSGSASKIQVLFGCPGESPPPQIIP